MHLHFCLIFFLCSVRAALITVTSQNKNLVWERDVTKQFGLKNSLAGEPYISYTSSRGRVSASTFTSTDESLIYTFTGSAGSTKDSFNSKSTSAFPVSSPVVENTERVTTLLTLSASTTTSTLFSTSIPVQTAQINGTRLTSISTGGRNPLVTQKPSSSIQATVINPVTLNSNRTLSSVPVTTTASSPYYQLTTVIASLNNTVAVSSSASTAIISNLASESTKKILTGELTSSNLTFWPTAASSLSSSMSSKEANSNHLYTTSLKSVDAGNSSYPVAPTSYTFSQNEESTFVSHSSLSPSSMSHSSFPLASSSTNPPSSSLQSSASSKTNINLFEAISTDMPPVVFPRASNPMSLANGVANNGPIQTNKFYTNLMVGSQSSAAFVYPYSLWKYTQGQNVGIAMHHTSSEQYSFGNYDADKNSQFLINPLNVAELFFSSKSFDSKTTMKISNMTASSTVVKLAEASDSNNYLEVPLVQGMGFATGIYHGSTTFKLGSGVGFKTLSQETSQFLADGILKYRVELLNGISWLCYVVLPENIPKESFKLEAQSAYSFVGNVTVDGLIIQTSVAPEDTALEVFYDQAAGMYVTDFQLDGISDGSVANYEFSYDTMGRSLSGSTIIFALPHHESSLLASMQNSFTGIYLQSTTKGVMKGYLTTRLQFSQTLNKQISWLPWSPQLNGRDLEYSSDQLKLLAEVANSELQVSISSSISQLNTYYIGKVLDKYAYILLTVSQIVSDEKVTESTLANMKAAFEVLLNNRQLYPLIYDTKFNGLVSSGDWASTSTQYDFGNTYYNDHHFHYGYIIHAAAVIGYVDAQLGGNWATENEDWVNTLVRDVANPSNKDQYFATSRMFDWYHGHSWAAGLFENGNGKNEESSSEDYNFAYAMKLWGSVIGDRSMELRGDLMISVMSQSMNEYFLYENSNAVEPKQIIGNKVCGILFDNIIDYTTYFGTNLEYKHGIHMLPITPVSAQIRQPSFVKEEWQEKISPILASVKSGWTGILRLNEALFDPADSYAFFSDRSFDSNLYLDNGMSRTWALAFSGGLANSLGLL